MGIVEVRGVTKSYVPGSPVLRNLDLTVEPGEFVVLLGESGCGKTTLLKMINKLLLPDSGEIRVRGRPLAEWDTIGLRRSIGYVIQQVGLLPHLNIENNLTYVLSLQKTDRAVRHARARELLDLLGFDPGFLQRYPRELSGGQRQRIGVARALAADPEIILMDEPFGAVDEIARSALQDELLALQSRLKKTILFVTHDIQEALKLGSRIVLLRDGRIEQDGRGEDLIFRPGSSFVKDFFGLKGFRAMLDEQVVRVAYAEILEGRKTVEAFYRSMRAGTCTEGEDA